MAYTTIKKPSDYFNTVLYTGDGQPNRAVTGVGFQPDWVWIKNRTSATEHLLFDIILCGFSFLWLFIILVISFKPE